MPSVRRGIVLLVAALAALVLAAPAAAKKFEVTERTDPAPDGCTNRDCSLREAVIAANANPGPDRVVLPKKKAYSLSIENSIPPGEDAAAEGDLDVTGTLKVTHPGKGRAKVDANGIDRVFEVLAGAPTTFKRIVVTGGLSPVAGGDGGGGILADADLTLRRSAVSGNHNLASFGGGIMLLDDAGLTVRRSSLSNNRSDSDSGAVEAGEAPIVIARSKVIGNLADGTGGGLYLDNDASETRIIKSTIAGNESASGAGGGFHSSGPVSVDRSTISGNTADGVGGGIETQSVLSITNSTIAGNHSTVNGGGIFGEGDVSLNAVTVVRNSADEDGGGLLYGVSGPGFEVRNSLIALNTADELGDDCTGGDDFDSLGNNLIGDDTDCAGFDAPGDFVNPNPKLGQLKNNGGLTQTVKLKKGSPAINNADKQSAPNKDQRGEKRGKKPDIGAYERIKKKQQGKQGKK